MRLAVRVLVALVTVLFGWLTAFSTVLVAVVPADAAPAYTYDSHHTATSAAPTTTERGPPSTYDRHTTYNAVDRWSHGASTRLDGTSPSCAFAYDHPALLRQIARSSGTTPTGTDVDVGVLASLERPDVAANAVPKALPSGPKIKAQWGADTYRHGGLMSTIEHISYRYAYNSGFSGSAGTPKKRR